MIKIITVLMNLFVFRLILLKIRRIRDIKSILNFRIFSYTS